MKMGLAGSDGEARHLRDLAMLIALDIMKDEDQPSLDRQAPDRPLEIDVLARDLSEGIV
jgi:hypothetical protein